MTDWTPEEDEAFNEVEKQSNLGKQILKAQGQPYHYEKREWVGLTDDEIWEVYKKYDSMQYMAFSKAIEAKLKEKNT